MTKRKDAQTIEPSQYISTEQAAKQIGVSSRWIRLKAEAGEIEGVKIGRAWLVNIKSLKAFQDRRAG